MIQVNNVVAFKVGGSVADEAAGGLISENPIVITLGRAEPSFDFAYGCICLHCFIIRGRTGFVLTECVICAYGIFLGQFDGKTLVVKMLSDFGRVLWKLFQEE